MNVICEKKVCCVGYKRQFVSNLKEWFWIAVVYSLYAVLNLDELIYL